MGAIQPKECGTQESGNTKGKGKYHCTVDLLFDWLGLVCFQIKTKIVSCHTAESKPVKQKVNGTVILPPLVFPAGVGGLAPVSQLLLRILRLLKRD
jgi:hypothetical protein